MRHAGDVGASQAVRRPLDEPPRRTVARASRACTSSSWAAAGSGSTLAHSLEQQGHTVAVIDQDPTAFRRLGRTSSGRRVAGIGFDRDTLREAGIEEAEAFAAVSSGDNSNIIAARVARETFGVDNVVARIYDPGRAEVYQRLGIPTVATVRWTADQMMRRLLPARRRAGWRDPSGGVRLAEVHRRRRLGRPAGSAARGGQPAPGSRSSPGSARACCPTPDTVLQDGDLVHVVMRATDDGGRRGRGRARCSRHRDGGA